jgi:hypothetical protein
MGLEPHAMQLHGEVDAEAVEIMHALGEKYGMLGAMPLGQENTVSTLGDEL